jgi:hypothetical protein
MDSIKLTPEREKFLQKITGTVLEDVLRFFMSIEGPVVEDCHNIQKGDKVIGRLTDLEQHLFWVVAPRLTAEARSMLGKLKSPRLQAAIEFSRDMLDFFNRFKWGFLQTRFSNTQYIEIRKGGVVIAALPEGWNSVANRMVHFCDACPFYKSHCPYPDQKSPKQLFLGHQLDGAVVTNSEACDVPGEFDLTALEQENLDLLQGTYIGELLRILSGVEGEVSDDYPQVTPQEDVVGRLSLLQIHLVKVVICRIIDENKALRYLAGERPSQADLVINNLFVSMIRSMNFFVEKILRVQCNEPEANLLEIRQGDEVVRVQKKKSPIRITLLV